MKVIWRHYTTGAKLSLLSPRIVSAHCEFLINVKKFSAYHRQGKESLPTQNSPQYKYTCVWVLTRPVVSSQKYLSVYYLILKHTILETGQLVAIVVIILSSAPVIIKAQHEQNSLSCIYWNFIIEFLLLFCLIFLFLSIFLTPP